jgi:hypothetical protein
MYHVIEFTEALTLDLEISAKHQMERVAVGRGSRQRAQIRPFVAETEDGPAEMADLFFEDGTATRGVRFASFFFVE